MKNLAIVSLSLIALASAGQARAEYFAFCTLAGGAEKALMKAPKTFYVEEYGSVSLVTETDSNGKKSGLSKIFSTDKGNLAVKEGWPDVVLRTKESLSQGTYTLDIQSCDKYQTSQAMFTWSNPSLDTIQNNGTAIYDCECGVD